MHHQQKCLTKCGKIQYIYQPCCIESNRTNKLTYHHLKTRRCVQVKTLLFNVVFNDVISKSREQRLITKEHIATYANLVLLFKPALYSITLVIELFESSIKLFYAEILTVTL